MFFSFNVKYSILYNVRERVNEELSSSKTQTSPWDIYIPPPGLCTDNGVIVAWAGVELFKQGISDDVNEVMHPIPRWKIGDSIPDEKKNMFRKRRSFKTGWR